MRKVIKAAISLLLLSMAFASCDDSGGGGSTGSPGSAADMFGNGIRLKSCGGNRYYYDEKGRIESIDIGSYDYVFSYSPNKIDVGDDTKSVSVSYNGNGYLSSMKISSKEESLSSTENISFSYNGNGHLTKMSMTGNASGMEDGKKQTGTQKITATFSWEGDLLAKVECKEEGKSGNNSFSSTDIYAFTYDRDDREYNYNKYCQYTPDLLQWYEGDFNMRALFYVGLLGKGPLYLPSSCDYEYQRVWITNGKKEENSGGNSYSLSYGFNKDGTLSKVYSRYSSYSYDYMYVDTGSSGNLR